MRYWRSLAADTTDTAEGHDWKAGISMQKWDYSTAYCYYRKDDIGWRLFYDQKELPLEKALAKYGAEGWELAAVQLTLLETAGGATASWSIFKRAAAS